MALQHIADYTPASIYTTKSETHPCAIYVEESIKQSTIFLMGLHSYGTTAFLHTLVICHLNKNDRNQY
jgi:hypothetical protein